MIEVHRLGVDEGPRLRAIRLRALADAPDAFASTHEETAARTDESWRAQLRDLATFVVVRDGVDVGMVRGGPDDDREGTAWLLSMWVAPEARGLGVGEALVREIVAWARAGNCDRLLLDVADDNRPAVDLYARMGFVPNGETSTLPPPREHVREHQRELRLT